MIEILKYINENLDSKLSLKEMSRLSGYSTWHFCEKFKSYTGENFHDYINGKRIQSAARDILSGQKVIDVAINYGYSDSSGFNRAFLREYRCSPSQYRKNCWRYNRIYKESRENMLRLSDRCVILKENAVNTKTNGHYINGQIMYGFVKGYHSVPKDERNNRTILTNCLTTLLGCFEPLIFENEMIVGYNYSDWDFEQSGAYINNPEDEKRLRDYLNDGILSSEKKEELISLLKGGDKYSGGFVCNMPGQIDPSATPEMKGLVQEIASIGWCMTNNHSVIGYEQVLKHGFSGISEKLEACKGEFYDSLKKVCTAAGRIGLRYAQKAFDMMKTETDMRLIKELGDIKSVCERVPLYPARSFREAIQSLWFAHIINTWEDGINANSLGRLDQILYPYYKQDIESGVLSKEDAFEIICCLWLKLYRDYDVQQSTVGGCGADGNSAVNELSYLMLDAVESLDFIRCISVRYSHETDKGFIRRALEVVGHVQKGVPFFFNDDVMIKALSANGIKERDARDYAAIGCVEIVIPGKSNPHAVTGQCNLLKAVEYVLANGESILRPGLLCGPRTGKPSDFDSFDDFKAAIKVQMKHIIDTTCTLVNHNIPIAAKNSPLPYKSLLTEGCIEKGLDFNAGGPIYNYYQIMLMGIPNLVDSLTAIKTMVYDKSRCTMDELVFQIKNNFPNEVFRLELLNKCPKYGNDITEVNELANELFAYACDCVSANKSLIGEGFHAQPFTFLWMFGHGINTAATPDGRKSGEVFAYSMSSMQGRDFNGFTALLNSIAGLPTYKAPGTASAIVEADPYLFTELNIDRLTDIFLAASEKGLANVQFNIIDRKTLLDAQKHPEKYQNLAVRVSGFSQRFVLLDQALQNHIIARTKHSSF